MRHHPRWPHPRHPFWHWFRHHLKHHSNRHRKHVHVVLFVNGTGFLLHPNEENCIMTTAIVGQTITYAIGYLDTAGNPMTSPPTPDSAPAWTQTDPATDTLTAAADGNSATALTLAAGTDSISVSLSVGGVSFTASDAVTVTAAAQKLGSIVLNATVA